LISQSILLIHPPIAKPCEPPAGVAKLAKILLGHGVDCRVYDASIDGILGLMKTPMTADDTWTRRAIAHRRTHIEGLRSLPLFSNPDRYKRAVMDVNRLLAMAGRPFQTTLSLANYTDAHLTPVRSRDLVQAAEAFTCNPFYPIFSRKLTSLFEQSEPDFVGLSINFMSQALCAFAIIGFIRKQLPQTRIICGGGLVTSWMNIPGVDNPFQGLVDELVCGPGESRLLQLCTGKQLQAVQVTGYDFSLLETAPYLAPKSVLPYAASRGCWWKKCAFCPETAEDARYITDDSGVVVDELTRLVDDTGAGLVHFLDNALSPRLLDDLCDHPLPTPWYGFARVTRHLTDIEFVRRLKKAGCVMLKLGVESGDQRVLDALGKGIDIAVTAKALHTLNMAGIATYVYLLFGTPDENEASAEKTLAFTLKHSPAIDFLNLAVFNLPAYSQEALKLETLDFYEGDLSLYREFIHPCGWRRDQVRRFLSNRFKKQTTIREILTNDPPYFTSNHAPFLISH
jgi:hypothetical protein